MLLILHIFTRIAARLPANHAIDEIREQVLTIQGTAQTTAGDIRSITQTIRRVTSISASGAAAVEEQNAATSEISRSVQRAAHGVQQVNENIAAVADDTVNAGRVAETVGNAAEMLQESYVNLEGAVVRFLEALRRDQTA